MPILALVASMLSQTIISALHQRAINRQGARATNAVQAVFERMRNEPLEDVLALYNAEPLDDLDGPGTAPGARFDITGLPRLNALPGQPVGELVMPLVNVAPVGDPEVWELREDVDLPQLGMPRDLNRDFAIDDLDHSGDYIALPVMARVRWQGPLGPRELRMFTLLIEYRMEVL